MIFVISPLVKEANPSRRWVRVGLYLGSLVASAALIGTIFATAGKFVVPKSNWTTAVVGVLAVILSIRELGLLRLKLPSRNWQMPREWLRFGYYRSAAIYGGVLGLGVLTRAPYGSYHTVLILQSVLGQVGLGAILGGVYGLARGASLLPALQRNVRRSGNLVPIVSWISGQAGYLHVLNGLALAVAGSAMLLVSVIS